MNAQEWTPPSAAQQMINWANEPNLYGPCEEDADDFEERNPSLRLLENFCFETGYSTCGAPTVQGTVCGFPQDRYGSCGVESRHEDG